MYNGAVLADEEDVVVVSPNYRVSIFGFSGAPNQTQNVGLLDQRLALEWTRDNVEAFGGDPNRIIVFGQSAGSMTADLIPYAFPDDPIAHAIIPESGLITGFLPELFSSSTFPVTSNWYAASKSLGCGGEEAGEATVECMKGKSTSDILKNIEPFQLTAIFSGFTPVFDNIYKNYATRGQAGEFAKIPMLTGHTSNEISFFLIIFIAYTSITQEQLALISPLIPLIQPVIDIITLAAFTCPAGQGTGYRVDQQVPVWRYRYFGGNYTNTHITDIGSAYHMSELPLVFGTSSAVSGVPDSDYEAKTAAYMRRAWSTFAKDPIDGLSRELKWPKYSTDLSGTLSTCFLPALFLSLFSTLYSISL